MSVKVIVQRAIRGAAIGLALSVAACNSATDGTSTGNSGTGSAAPQQSRPVRAYSLLANNHLLVADVASGATIAELTLAPGAPLPAQIRGLALSADGARLFALVRETEMRAVIAAIDTTTLMVTARLTLAEPAEYRGLSIGARTGRLYVYATRGGDAIVTVLDSLDGSAETWVARTSEGRSWWVYQGVVTADESTLFLSYHGPDTTGIDRFAISQSGLTRCSSPPEPESGCFRSHGSFLLSSGELLLAATGEPRILAIDAATGRTRQEYRFALDGNHIMEFALAPGDQIYAVGSCAYSGGLAVVELASGQSRLLAPPRQLGGICGERIAVASDGSLVIAQTARPIAGGKPGALVHLAPSGQMLATLPTSAEPIDLLLPH